MQRFMFQKTGLSHSVNTPQHSVFLFSLSKQDIDLKRLYNMPPFVKWVRISQAQTVYPTEPGCLCQISSSCEKVQKPRSGFQHFENLP